MVYLYCICTVLQITGDFSVIYCTTSITKVVPYYRGREKETIVSLLAVFCCNLDQQIHTLVHRSGRRYLRGIRKWIK